MGSRVGVRRIGGILILTLLILMRLLIVLRLLLEWWRALVVSRRNISIAMGVGWSSV